MFFIIRLVFKKQYDIRNQRAKFYRTSNTFTKAQTKIFFPIRSGTRGKVENKLYKR